jgi:NAD(P)-dependent dehydrogenase (short-subunit alcohol dehydrogenase family)
VDRAFAELRATHGRLDVLVNNAGIAGPTGRVEDIDPDAWQRTIAVDLNGQFYCARQAVPMLRAAGGGSIICIASTAALFGFPLRSPYAACKWAIVGFVKTLAMELGPEKIRVNAICPGSVSGPRIDGVIERDAASRGMEPQAIRDIYLRQTSMRTFVDAEDVAEMAYFLASSAGAKIRARPSPSMATRKACRTGSTECLSARARRACASLRTPARLLSDLRCRRVCPRLAGGGA